MAVTLKQVGELLDRHDLDAKVREIEEQIDNKLQNPEWVDSWKCGDVNEPFWRFSFKGHVRESVMLELQQRYTSAGWTKVETQNHTFDDPRENSFTVLLYGNP